MSSTASNHGAALEWDAPWLECRQTRSSLADFERRLHAAAASAAPELCDIALHVVGAGGKRLRPALVLLAGGFGDAHDPRLLDAAVAVELLHTASLLHDDIVDRATVRRGVTSVNRRWGNARAAAAGTFLFATASALLARTADKANRLASEAVVDLCSGQLQEVEHAFDLDLSDSEHLEIIGRKTAPLFELPCRLGALLSGAPPEAERALSAYGHELGLAFQLTDDALDLVGEAAALGKTPGTDIREGVYALPVLLALRTSTEATRLRALLELARPGEAEIAEVLHLVGASGAIERAMNIARRQARLAHAELQTLPDGPPRRSLLALIDHVLARAR